MIDEYYDPELDVDDVDTSDVDKDFSSENDLNDSSVMEESVLSDFVSESLSSSVIEDNSESQFHAENEDFQTRYRPKSLAFQGHGLSWNGRCRVCSCGKWAGFGDTCACCGHFYKDHI